MAEDVKEQLLRYLSDAHAAEVGGLTSLKDLVEGTSDANVRQVVADHVTVTQSQIERLEARIEALGGGRSEGKGLLNTIIGKGTDLLNIFHSIEDKQTQDLIKTYSLEHFEVGMYMSIEAYADAIGDTETARMATAFIAEEQMAAERVSRLIPEVATSALKNSTSTPSAA